MDRLIYYYICALIDNRILNPPSPLCSWNIFALHRLLVNFFADLTIDNAKSTQLVYNSGKWLLVCNPWNWVKLLVCSPWGMQASHAASDQYCPRSILVSPPPAWLHSTRTRAIRSFIALAWGGHDLVHNVRIVPPNPRGDDNTEKYCPRPEGPRAIFLIISSSSQGNKALYCPGPGGMKPCRRRRNQYWPRAILVARRLTCLHPSTENTSGAITSTIGSRQAACDHCCKPTV